MTICDRCGEDNNGRSLRIESYGHGVRFSDMCEKCQDSLLDIYKVFMKGANLELFGTKFYKENYKLT